MFTLIDCRCTYTFRIQQLFLNSENLSKPISAILVIKSRELHLKLALISSQSCTHVVTYLPWSRSSDRFNTNAIDHSLRPQYTINYKTAINTIRSSFKCPNIVRQIVTESRQVWVVEKFLSTIARRQLPPKTSTFAVIPTSSSPMSIGCAPGTGDPAIWLPNSSRAASKQKENRRQGTKRGHGELLRDWSPLGVPEYFVGGWELLYKAFHGSWYIAVALTCCFTVALDAFSLKTRSRDTGSRSPLPHRKSSLRFQSESS